MPDSARSEPTFHVGQCVRVILNEKNRTPHTGTVRTMVWHYKDGRYYYLLEEGGKKVSKRYAAEDLELVSELRPEIAK
jgi:hypothetical protein